MRQSPASARPYKPPERIQYLDSLRAFALTGIILVHFVLHFQLPFDHAFDQRQTTAIDTWTFKMATFFLVGKMYSIFSLIFGVSFSLSQERMASEPTAFTNKFGYRTLLLLGFALTHNLYYYGDFLITYAVLSPILLIGSRISTRILLVSAVFLLIHPFQLLMIILQLASPAESLSAEVSYQTLPHPSGSMEASWATSILTVFVNRWNEGFITQTAGLFVLGLYLGRHKVLLSNNAVKWILSLAFFLFSASVLYIIRRYLETLALSESLTASSDLYLNHLFCFFLAGTYVSLFIVLWIQFGSIQTFLTQFTSFGRMSLTHYMFHSAVGVFVFGPAGLGLAGRIGFASAACLGLGLIVIQWAFSQMWIRHFKHGPLEALWRNATSKLCQLSSRR
ncbi:MAG: DUF418 domain-containing protein [Opitutales bacterium]|nr:DUF418 domain-containing protein [Opitutales bacterium]